MAVRGPRGAGLDRQQIIATFERRLAGHPDFELAECLRNIHRIAEIRLNDKFGFTPTHGNQVWDCAELLATHSDPEFKAQGQLTVTYLTDAHQACQVQLLRWMRDCGFDEANVDAVGNVVGVYHGSDPKARRLLTGSHFDTVRNGGKYDGRLGIFVPLVCVRELQRAGRRLPFGFEVVGVRRGRRPALQGHVPGLGRARPATSTRHGWRRPTPRASACDEAMRAAGLPAKLDAIARLKRDPARLSGFCRGAHRARPGAERHGPAAGRGDFHQRQRALPGRSHRHGQPRRHHADGRTPRRRHSGGRTGAVP